MGEHTIPFITWAEEQSVYLTLTLFIVDFFIIDFDNFIIIGFFFDFFELLPFFIFFIIEVFFEECGLDRILGLQHLILRITVEFFIISAKDLGLRLLVLSVAVEFFISSTKDLGLRHLALSGAADLVRRFLVHVHG